MGILDEDVQRVREATDLVALAGEHLALKRVGRSVHGLCPFHQEKSPSFTISPEKQVFYCFGCQKSGDAITFVRELEHLDFVEAVERLAARAGITLRYDDASHSRRTASASNGCRKRSRRRSTSTTSSCSTRSPRAPRVVTCAAAGSTAASARRFSLGWSPDGFDAVERASAEEEVLARRHRRRRARVREQGEQAPGLVPQPGDVPDLGRARRAGRVSAAARSTRRARSTRTPPTPRSTRSPGCSTACTGRRARSSRAARSSSARATPT